MKMGGQTSGVVSLWAHGRVSAGPSVEVRPSVDVVRRRLGVGFRLEADFSPATSGVES